MGMPMATAAIGVEAVADEHLGLMANLLAHTKKVWNSLLMFWFHPPFPSATVHPCLSHRCFVWQRLHYLPMTMSILVDHCWARGLLQRRLGSPACMSGLWYQCKVEHTS